jgi:hypothetical protein
MFKSSKNLHFLISTLVLIELVLRIRDDYPGSGSDHFFWYLGSGSDLVIRDPDPIKKGREK